MLGCLHTHTIPWIDKYALASVKIESVKHTHLYHPSFWDLDTFLRFSDEDLFNGNNPPSSMVILGWLFCRMVPSGEIQVILTISVPSNSQYKETLLAWMTDAFSGASLIPSGTVVAQSI